MYLGDHNDQKVLLRDVVLRHWVLIDQNFA